MRITTPMRVAIVCAFLVAAMAAVTVGHFSAHAAAPAKKASSSGKLIVNPGTVMLLTDGGFSTTVYGQGLAANTYYKLFDTNTNCEDSINSNSPNVLTDLNGRFAYTLSAVTSSGPCLAGGFKVSVIGGTKAKTITTNVTLAHSQVLPTSAVVAPKWVVSMVDGSFVTTVNITGLKPATTYYITDDNSACQTSYNSYDYNYSSTSFPTDSEGNAELLLHGGPDSYSVSTPCNPGTYTETITGGGLTVPIKTSWVLEPAQP